MLVRINYYYAIDDDRRDPCSVLMRVVKRGPIRDLLGVQDGEVSTVAACVGSELSDRLIQGLLVATGDGNQGAFRDEETGRRLSLAN